VNRAKRQFRATVFSLSVVGMFFLLTLRVSYLAVVVHDDATAEIRRQVISEEPIPHRRGRILDRSGSVIVDSRPSIDLWVNGREVKMTGPRFAELARGLKLPFDVLDAPRARLSARALRGDPKEVKIEAGSSVSRSVLDHLPGVRVDNDTVYLDPTTFPSSERLAFRLSRYLNLSPKRRRRLARIIEGSGSRERLLLADIGEPAWHAIAAELSTGRLGGVKLREGMRRAYRHGRTGYHILGYLNEVTEEELKRYGGVIKGGELVGRAGVERHMEAQLRGRDGARFVVRDSRGGLVRDGWVKQMLAERPPRLPLTGHDVELTLDLGLQEVVEKSFGHRRGAVIAIDVRNGEILAMASFPRPDPNRIRRGSYNAAVTFHPDKPLVNRVLAEHYAPASTFKVVTALAGLRSGKLIPHHASYCNGRFSINKTTWACWKRGGHGGLDLIGALRHSCNIYFYRLAEHIGLDPILDTARLLGFAEAAGLSVGPEAPGVLPTHDYCRERKYWVDERGRKHRLRCTTGDAVNASIGQGFVTVTPYQLALAYARIASGKRVEPRVVRRVVTKDGREVIAYKDADPPSLGVESEHLKLVREGLRQVVMDPRGTAYSAFHNTPSGSGARRLRDAGIAVAGKTGTAQVRAIRRDRKGRAMREIDYLNKDHAWFAGFAPADNPVIAVAVLVEHGGSGGKAAAPIAFEVLAGALVPEDNG
jgi:penicillin-binding protein 2